MDKNRFICVGTGMTEYIGSDCRPYEVVAVRDPSHITVRRYDHKKKPGTPDYSNDWDLVSNPNNPERDMVLAGGIWYWGSKGNGKRTKANVSFGHAEYYYDYEF